MASKHLVMLDFALPTINPDEGMPSSPFISIDLASEGVSIGLGEDSRYVAESKSNFSAYCNQASFTFQVGILNGPPGIEIPPELALGDLTINILFLCGP